MEWTGWTAGIVDGEGTISIVPRLRSDKKCRVNGWIVKVMVGNTNKSMIEKLVSLWGGSIYHRKFDSLRPNHSESWTWCLTATKAANVLGKILPYLVAKKEQALVAIAMQERISGGIGFSGPKHNRRSGVTEEEERERFALYRKMKDLNVKPGVRLWQLKAKTG